MPWLPRSTTSVPPIDAPHAGSSILQLFRGPTQPDAFPASIVSGLSSSDSVSQLTAIAELRDYMRRLFFLEINDFVLVSTLVTAGILALLIVIGIPVIIHRVYHKRLAVFRIERRTQGLYIVPNAINCFLLLEGIYGVVTIAFNAVFWRLYHDQDGVMVKYFQSFRILAWIPLYLGAFFTGWGTFYSAPGALDKPTAAKYKTSARGRVPWPMIVNLSCLGTPIILIISLLAPVILASNQMVDAFSSYKRWDQTFQMLIDASPVGELVDQSTINGLSSQAFTIFTSWTKSYYYSHIAYTIWCVWSVLFLVFYVPAGGFLVYLLFRQLRKQKAILLSHQQKIAKQPPQDAKMEQVHVLTGDSAHLQASRHGGRSSRYGAHLRDIHEDRPASGGSGSAGNSGATASYKGSRDLLGLESALNQGPPASYQVHGALTPGVGSQAAQMVSLADELDQESSSIEKRTSSPPLTPRTPSTFRKLIRMDTRLSSHRSGQRSPKASKPKRISITGGPMSRYKYLRRCLVNLLILYFGIIVAAVFFNEATFYLAVLDYRSALKGPDAMAKTITVAEGTVIWATAVFGVITIGSIIFRNFDNANPDASQNSGDKAPKRRFTRNTTQPVESGPVGPESGAGARSPAMQEKTRTLPAVPESVDLEASMISVTRSRPRMANDSPVKFTVAEHSQHDGGFVIRPDDPLASVMSTDITPEREEGPHSSYLNARGRGGPLRPPPAVVRLWPGRERDALASFPQDVTLNSMQFGMMSSHLERSRHSPGEQDPAVDPAGFFRPNDTTLAAYPSFDPQVIKQEQDVATKRTRQPSNEPREEVLASPVLKRRSRLSESVDDTPASRIAREWAQSQYLTTPLPETPTVGGGRSVDAETLASPAVSPPTSPPRPTRDLRRLVRDADSPRRIDAAL